MPTALMAVLALPGALMRSRLVGLGSSTIRCGAQITIHCVGKRRTASSSEAFTDAGYDEYALRSRVHVELSTVWHKGDAELLAAIGREREKRGAVVCLDERGPTCTSVAFSERLYHWLEEGGSRLAFVIGGAEGLPNALRPSRAGAGVHHLSLGELTFTHQMARLVLAEQIYRGTQYHKE